MTTPLSQLRSALSDRYELQRELGRGGMATVYLARDVRHERLVALKVLDSELAAVLGAERFLSEIRTTANLQHPHILPLFDSGAADGQLYYVMPFVEGETLRARLERERQLPVDDALQIAAEVADALDYAHRHGVVHRDIKPENVLLHDGHALVADFGIALAVEHAGGQRMTQTGLSLGTPHYMAPEQAMGERSIDARADIYALGAVTYEMLAGEPPFTGPTAQAIVAQVITTEPEPLATRRRSVPAHVDAAVLRALEKLPADRFPDARAFAELLTGTVPGVRTAPARRRGPQRVSRPLPRRLAVLVAGGVVGALALGLLLGRRLAPGQRPDAPPARFVFSDVGLGAGPSSGILTLSPDGRTVVYFSDAAAGSSLWVRRIDERRSVMLPDTREGYDPAFSPDGRSIVFTRARKAYRVSLDGGTPILIPGLEADRPLFVWLEDNTIVYRGDDGGLYRVAAAGGTAARLTSPDSAAREVRQAAVAMLPDDRHLLVLGEYAQATGRLYAVDITSGRRTTIVESGVAAARFLPPNHLVYTDERGALLAVPVDLRALRMTTAPVRLAEAISNTSGGAARFATSQTGAVVYESADPPDLVLVDRGGAARVVSDVPREYHNPRFSADGRRILLDVQTADAERDAWILDIDQRGLTRASLAGDGHDAIWSRDGRSIIYLSARPEIISAFRVSAAGGGTPERLMTGHGLNTITGVAPDGTLIGVAASRQPGSDWDLVAFHPGDTLRDVLVTRYAEAWPSLSPDGQWLAYASNESGQPEVYLRPLDGAGGRLQVSLDGATEPVWNPNGRELFYRRLTARGSELVAAALTVSPDPHVTARRALFDATGYEAAVPHANYDVSPDGQHFVMVRRTRARGLVYLQNVPALVRGIRTDR